MFANFLKGFGKIMPKRNTSFEEVAPTRPPKRDTIDPSLIRFTILTNAVSLQIEWVDCLSLHLELDTQAKTLKLFRYPSFCLLMSCTSSQQRSPLSQIFHDSAMYEPSQTRSDHTKSDHASEYFKEVLLTYRLLFGQKPRDSIIFTQLYQKEWSRLPSFSCHPDPLLPRLCGQLWNTDEVRAIYDEIEADDALHQYSSQADFPFLGRSLLALQEYVEGHEPRTFKELWHDGRNTERWWESWTAIVIGALGLFLTFILMLIQVVLQFYQVDLAKQQLAQGNG
ncbi:hypothetical protein B0O99DRAFT_9320 [Bisporella sp. PMI_857]|nr:hypothetical protein B0O99DRAFT_9320 [Bisporella sp. PMI_857]